jgi:chemotaxis response regulator CheB
VNSLQAANRLLSQRSSVALHPVQSPNGSESTMSPADQDPGVAAAATPSGAPDEAAAPVDFAARSTLTFPVVGIGASAGGVEVFRTFFAACSPESGMAYVVIQHLSPEHESLMAEILGRCTPMPVRQIEEGMRVEPPTVLRRMQRRMGLAGIERLEDYGARLRDKPEEAVALAGLEVIEIGRARVRKSVLFGEDEPSRLPSTTQR